MSFCSGALFKEKYQWRMLLAVVSSFSAMCPLCPSLTTNKKINPNRPACIFFKFWFDCSCLVLIFFIYVMPRRVCWLDIMMGEFCCSLPLHCHRKNCEKKKKHVKQKERSINIPTVFGELYSTDDKCYP